MSDKKVCYRNATIVDIPQLVSLINVNYKRQKNEAYFRWQFFTRRIPSILMCAFKGKKLVGMFGLQKRILSPGNLRCGQAIDFLVSNEWRRKGIFTNLGRLAENYFKDLDLFCTFGNINGKTACEKGLLYTNIKSIKSMVLKKSLPVNKFDALCEPITQKTKFHNINKKIAKNVIKFKYDSFYRKWRYALNPQYSYSMIKIKSGEYGIFKIFKEPGSNRFFGDIVDFECPLDEKNKLNEIFLSCCYYLQKNFGIKQITTWAIPGTILYEIIKGIGFTESEQERYFCIKLLTDKFPYHYSWNLVQADSEVY